MADSTCIYLLNTADSRHKSRRETGDLNPRIRRIGAQAYEVLELLNITANKIKEKGDCSFEEGSVYLKVRSARKPKLCPFRLSTDEKTLMWFSGKDGKHLHLSSVRSIIRRHQTLSVYQDNAIVALKRERIFYSTVREGTLNSARSGYSR
ncbi:hypothetical protein Tco_0404721, partial [Tanacetum coccineum]